MHNIPYDLGFRDIEVFVREYSVGRVLLQIADGLKFLTREYTSFLRSLGAEPVLSASHAFGACDIAYNEALVLGVDAIIHVGHNRYWYYGYSIDIPVLYIPCYYTGGIQDGLLDEIVSTLAGYRRVVVTASIQYLRLLDNIKEYLVDHGVDAIIPISRDNSLYNGQVIGCNYTVVDNVDEVDAYIVVSSGFFHALGLCLYKPFKKVYLVDIERSRVVDMESYCRKILSKRLYIVSKLIASPPHSICIINGLKPGQYRVELEETIKGLLESGSYSVETVYVDNLFFDEIASIDNALKCDVYVVLSCPRIPVDDLADFHKPVLTPGEALMLINKTLDYRFPW